MMRRVWLIALGRSAAFSVLLLASCFSPHIGECRFRCDTGSHCPGGLACGMDGYCHGDGQLNHCGVAGPCANNVKDPGESDVDCGGTCAPCAGGKACMGAGDCKSGTCAGGFCQLASGPPFWRVLPSPPSPLGFPCAATLPDGRILMIGGDMGGVAQTLAQAYTPKTSAWAMVAPLKTARYCFGCATGADGKVYAVGGVITGGGATASVEAYTAASDQWNDVASLPTPVNYLRAARGALDQIYASEGAHLYALSANAWITLPSPSMDQWDPGLALGPDDRLYLVGGDLNGTDVYPTVQTFETGSSRWSSAASLATPRWGLSAVAAPDGRLYAIGGRNIGSTLTTVEAYTPATNQWATVAALVNPDYFGGATIGAEGTLYAVGGQTLEAYGPVATLSSATATSGGSISISGSNFAASAQVVVSIEGMHIGLGTTDANGALPATSFTVPSLASGSHRLIIADDRSEYPITLSLDVM